MDQLTPEAVTERRIGLGLNRGKLAAEAGVAEATLWRLEMGKFRGNIATWRAVNGALDRLEAAR